MSKPANSESTAADPVIPVQAASNQEQPEALNAEAPETGQPEGIPEKFVGKTAAEIIDMYRNLESHSGRISSEKAQREKELEEQKERLRILEAQTQAQFAAQPSPQQHSKAEDTDPLQEFDKQFEQDPRAAIREGLKNVSQQVRETQERAQLMAQAQLQRAHYERQLENPDFKELEPEMVKIANELKPYLHPAFLNSPQAIDYMYNLAKGRNVQRYVDKATTNAKQAGNLVRDEKRKAFSESSTSEGSSGTKSPADMSLKELEALLGRASN